MEIVLKFLAYFLLIYLIKICLCIIFIPNDNFNSWIFYPTIIHIFLVIRSIRKDYNDSLGSADVLINYSDFVKYFNVNPDAYEINLLYYENLILYEHHSKGSCSLTRIGFKKYRDWRKANRMIATYQKEKNSFEKNKRLKNNMSKYLCNVQEDIDNLLKESRCEVNKAKEYLKEN